MHINKSLSTKLDEIIYIIKKIKVGQSKKIYILKIERPFNTAEVNFVYEMQSLNIDYLDLLDKKDKEQYLHLKEEFATSTKDEKNDKQCDFFQNNLDEIQKFCIRNQSDDWKRCLVCGIVWLDSTLLINMARLTKLISDSKNSFNCTISKLGYHKDMSESTVFQKLVEKIPFIKGNYVEQRNWSARTLSSTPPVSEKSDIDYSVYGFNPPGKPSPEVQSELSYPGARELENLFNIIDLKLKISHECKQTICTNDGFNFFSDPICCAPIDWFTPDIPLDTMISFG